MHRLILVFFFKFMVLKKYRISPMCDSIYCNGILHASLHGFCAICAERGKQNDYLLMLSSVIQSYDKWKKNAQQLKNKCYCHQLSLTEEGVFWGRPLELLFPSRQGIYQNKFWKYILSVVVFHIWNSVFSYRNFNKPQILNQ